MKIQLNKTSIEIMQDLIFQTVGIDLRNQYFEFGTPTALPPSSCGANTVVTMTADPMQDDQICGSTELLYRRLDLSQLPQASNVPLSMAAPFQITDLLPQINTLFGTQMTAADVVDTQYADFTQPIVLQAAPGSLIFVGQVDLSVEDPNSTVLIMNTGLNGFVAASGTVESP